MDAGPKGIHEAGTGIENPEMKEAAQGTGQGLEEEEEEEEVIVVEVEVIAEPETEMDEEAAPEPIAIAAEEEKEEARPSQRSSRALRRSLQQQAFWWQPWS